MIFNHNHAERAPQNRHVYPKKGSHDRPLNEAANQMIQNNSFGKFAHKHVLNKYGRPVVKNNRSVFLGKAFRQSN